MALILLMLTKVMPLILQRLIDRLTTDKAEAMDIEVRRQSSSLALCVKGHATESNIDHAITQFAWALDERCPLTIDLSGAETIDQRFLGLLMMVRKQASLIGIPFHLQAGTRRVKRAFSLNASEYLLSDHVRDGGERGMHPVGEVSRNMVARDA